MSELQADGLTENKIDLSAKGYIDVIDLARYLSLQLDKQVRHRDVFLIYERLKGENKLTFTDLLDVICRDY